MTTQKKSYSIIIAISILLALSALGGQVTGKAFATVLNPPFIYVNSPENGKIYSSTNIKLNFTVVPNMGSNFTSFSYSLDDQANQTTNGNTILTGLSFGSHTLRIYGKGTFQFGDSVQEIRYPLETIYFGIIFSTEGVILTLTVGSAFLIAGLALLKKRRQLAGVLKGKKTGSFWVGLVSFFVAILFLGLSLWQIAYKYYFWYYSSDVNTGSLTGIGIVLGSIFICTGLYLMRAGTKSKLISENQ